MRYEGQGKDQPGWYMGTGWLIRPDLMVTAGHNVWNWAANDGRGLGRAVTIRCYIGYHGRASLADTANVQQRLAKRAVTTAEWISSKSNRNRDFAFIQVDSPFTGNLNLFSYKSTPNFAVSEMLGVVGYPGDKCIRNEDDIEEKGAEMYEDFQQVDINMEEPGNSERMLTYRISTFGGKRGPSLLTPYSVSICVILSNFCE
jgi:V8-like Glu-specific endopeptidase